MTLRSFSLMVLFATACTTASSSPVSTQAAATGQQDPSAPSAEQEAAGGVAAASRPSMPLVARHHEGSVEGVVLSPDGGAALSFDEGGGVRLWPGFEEVTPLEVPVREPLWMSLAARDEGYLAAFIDTAGGTHVGHVTVDEGKARWAPAFDVSPLEPMLELHVLPGGDRILALGIDHRVRLWDAQGNTVAELDEHGVIPWQLRVQHDEAGTHVAVLQFSPVRVQRLEVSDARLELVGEPLAVAIDQSPNRNDIGMTPDGRYATAMQKRKRRSGRFEVELIDLRDGARRLLVAEIDGASRPRVHPLSDAIIVEDYAGAASRIPFDAAVPWQPGMDRDALPVVAAEPLTLGTGRLNEMNATVRGGVYARPTWDAIFVQPLREPGVGVRIERPSEVVAGALNADGSQAAWGTWDGKVWVEPVRSDGAARRVGDIGVRPELLVFVGDMLLVASEKGGVHLLDPESSGDGSVAMAQVPLEFQALEWRPAPEGGSLLVRPSDDDAPLQRIQLRDGQFLDAVTLTEEEQRSWAELGPPRGTTTAAWLEGLGHDVDGWDLPIGTVERAVRSPDGSQMAVIQDELVSVVDLDTQTRRWTRGFRYSTSVSWSDDGALLLVTDRSAGYVLDPATAEAVRKG